jgi:hypothetical protein
VSAKSANFYLSWRAQQRSAALQEGSDAPSEHILQKIWHHQRLNREGLKTCDGQPVQVLHPGFWNVHAGPDFKKAMIQVGSVRQTGDIEIDLTPGGWTQHAHNRNQAYKKVILHVVWRAAGNLNSLPTLELHNALDSALEDLVFWFGAHSAPPENVLGQCSAPLKNLEEPVLRDVLRQAARARLQYKAEMLQGRARQQGWEQALWEGVFAALGYSNNIWPMRRLAELRQMALCGAEEHSDPLLLVQARLLGLSGLLPPEITKYRPASQMYLRRLWDLWWREADSLRELALPRAIWKLGGLLPPNHPERRIALGAHWLLRGTLPKALEEWLQREIGKRDLVTSLETLLATGQDAFWNSHYSFASAPLKRTQPLIGSSRATDIAINVVLPWLWIRALAGGNRKMQAAAEARYFAWPRAQDNMVLRFARERLFGSAKCNVLKTAAEQQGLLQIVRDFCDYSNARCENCPFPDLLRNLMWATNKVVEIE